MEESIVIDTLDKVIVEVVLLLTKHIKHDQQLLEDIQKDSNDKCGITLAHLVLLLKF